MEVINGNLLGCLSRLAQKVDVLIFNPPVRQFLVYVFSWNPKCKLTLFRLFGEKYVPTPEEELGRSDIVAAWAGGSEGTSTLDLLMPQISHLLSPTGVFYCVVLAQNRPTEVAKRMKAHGLAYAKVIKKQQCIGELLYIIRFSKEAI